MSTKRTSLTVPPAPAPTRGDSEQIVEAIIGAAMVLPESASLKDIAECAGVGSASLHRYFPTKGALYAELARRVQRRTLEALRSIMADQSLSVDRALEAMCSMAVFLPQPLRRTLDLAVPFAWTEEHAAKTFAACIEEIAAWLSQRLTQAPDDLRLRVFAAFASIRGIIILSSMMPDAERTDEVLVGAMVRGVRAFLDLGPAVGPVDSPR